MHVVAENLRALLHLLTFDAESMIDWDGVTFYKSDDHKPSQRAARYAAWLQREFGLAPVTDADALVSAAQEKLKAEFGAWLSQYVSS